MELPLLRDNRLSELAAFSQSNFLFGIIPSWPISWSWYYVFVKVISKGGGDILAIIFENIFCNFVYFLGTVRAQISVDMSPGLTILHCSITPCKIKKMGKMISNKLIGDCQVLS